jgi:hypothetical protein
MTDTIVPVGSPNMNDNFTSFLILLIKQNRNYIEMMANGKSLLRMEKYCLWQENFCLCTEKSAEID